MRTPRTVCVLLSALATACSQSSAKSPRHDSSWQPPLGAASASLAARSVVESRYAHHWAAHAGFSADTLRARRLWFTPTLYELMQADMSSGDIGVIDHDPFVDAQDVASGYTVGSPRASHDTVFVPVAVRFASADDSRRTVTLAMLQGATGWQIGDFIDSNGSLADQLRKYPPPASSGVGDTSSSAAH